MSREIEFRDWYGVSAKVPMYYYNIKNVPPYDMPNSDPIRRMQFTGLFDRYLGRKIFEADILQNDVSKKTYQVIFSEGAYYITKPSISDKPRAKRIPLSGRTISDKWLCVIGNKCENPELLTPNQPTGDKE